jgi:hypothetical protein
MVSYTEHPVMPPHNVRIDATEVESQLPQVRGIHLASLTRSLAIDRPARHAWYHATSGRVQALRRYNELNCLQNSSVNTRPVGGPLYLIYCASKCSKIWSA